MSPYFKKQFIIAFIYLIFFSAIGGGIYFGFFYIPPSCQDGKLNQDEEEIDCGGLCAPCQEELFAPKVLWSQTFLVEGKQYDLAAQIENKNINHGTGLLSFVFKIYDANDNLLAEKRGKSYIMPREKKYIIESAVLNAVPSKIVLEFENILWKRFKVDDVIGVSLNLPVFGQKFNKDQKNSKAAFIEGTVFNKTDYDVAAIDINVVIYDSQGAPLAVNKTQKNIIQVGEGRYFQMFWPDYSISDEENNIIDIQAHTNIFSEENFIRTFLK